MTNEKRLIDANAFLSSMIKRFKCVPLIGRNDYDCESLKQMLIEAPTVDAVEVVHGYTIIADNPVKVLLDRKCGICDQLMLATDNYCPMCGARNEGEKIDGLLFADMEEIIDA